MAAIPSRARAAGTRCGFNGSNANEQMDVSANGSRVRFFRDVGNDDDGPERDRGRSNVNALGGADTITVNDLTGTDLKAANIDLSASGSGAGNGDGQPDTVIANGTGGRDNVEVGLQGRQRPRLRPPHPSPGRRQRADPGQGGRPDAGWRRHD